MIVEYRVNLLDRDGLYASVKPLVDALKRTRYVKGWGGRMIEVPSSALIYEDDEAHCDLRASQVEVGNYKQQHTTVTVEIRLSGADGG